MRQEQPDRDRSERAEPVRFAPIAVRIRIERPPRISPRDSRVETRTVDSGEGQCNLSTATQRSLIGVVDTTAVDELTQNTVDCVKSTADQGSMNSQEAQPDR